MWGKRSKVERKLTLEQLIQLFAIKESDTLTVTRVRIDNIIFTINKLFSDTYIKIHLTDGVDELLVYSGGIGDQPKDMWHHKGSWCDKIEKILREDYEQQKQREESIKQAEFNELNRLKEKFGALFSGVNNGN